MLSPEPAPLPAETTFFSVSSAVDALPPDRMTPLHRQLRTYWTAKRGTRRAPRRADFDPSDLPRALPHLALWTPDGPRDYRCRLAGTDIDASVGMRLTGISLRTIPCTRIDEAQAEFDAVSQEAHGSLVERTMNWAGKPYRYYHHLLLPFVDERDEVSTLLSVLTFHRVADRLATPAGRCPDAR
jgi:hypothetical protein